MSASPASVQLLRHWEFQRGDASPWQPVELPHSPFTAEPHGRDPWQGICAYRRQLWIRDPRPGERFLLRFHGAMRDATVLVDGKLAATHQGGYLPFLVDATGWLSDGAPHLIEVLLDNADNPDVPPGKPLHDLDFCWYGGLYREAELLRRPAVAISDELEVDEVAGGGVFVRTLRADAHSADLRVRVHMQNQSAQPVRLAVEADVRPLDGDDVADAHRPLFELAPGEARHVELDVHVEHPALWSPSHPHRYTLRVRLVNASGTVLDERDEFFGIRTLQMSRSGGLVLNGERIRPRGCNRHQDYPWVGYALPAAAQWRDARHIKEAGFDYVRLSHYPQSRHFLDACDALGILVLNAIPGWQFIGGTAFEEACYTQARRLIRRDRNHPCVIAWELSLNETAMPKAFMDTLHAIGHEEYPGDQMFTAGWKDYAYDIYLHARQHGRIHTWQNGDKPLIVSEYGDWEYYAATEGFDQKTGRGVLDPATNSRAFRGDGEAKLRRQANNFAEALNDTQSCPAITDGVWVMFDYPRGYDPTRAACGVMDFFRLPKFGTYLYRSQRDPHEQGDGWKGGPMVFIAALWQEGVSDDVVVYTNADEVELRLNGKTVARRQVARDDKYIALAHPPLHFALPFTPGTLEAVAYLEGKEVARHTVATAGAPARLHAWAAATPAPTPDGLDLVFVHVEVRDDAGHLCPTATDTVRLTVEGPAELAGPAEVTAEAGIASFLVWHRDLTKPLRLTASHPTLPDTEVTLPPAVSA